jgi:hypothetical protein
LVRCVATQTSAAYRPSGAIIVGEQLTARVRDSGLKDERIMVVLGRPGVIVGFLSPPAGHRTR